MLRYSIFIGGPTWTCTPSEACELAVGCVVVDDLGHDVSVEYVDEQVAANDEVVLVTVVGANEGFEVVGGAEVGDDGGPGGVDAGDLTAQGEEGAATFFVVLAGVFVGTVDVGLVAAEEPLCIGDLDAAVVDAGIAWLEMRKSALSSKFLGVPPRQMRKLFCLRRLAGVTSPIRT